MVWVTGGGGGGGGDNNSPIYTGILIQILIQIGNPDSDHLSHVDCDPDSDPDSGPGTHANDSYK